MSMQTTKPVIFVSYAHADEPENPRGEEIQWLSFVMKFLRPAVRSGHFAVWADRQMPGGTKWDQEIDRHLRGCDIFILLVSANSMGSEYIIDKELDIARERATCCSLNRRRRRESIACATSISGPTAPSPSRAIHSLNAISA
jgi:hypothetical protein